MDSCFIQWLLIHYYYLFWCHTVPDFASGSPSKLDSLSFDGSPPFFGDLLIFWHKMFQAHFVHSLPQSSDHSCIQKALILLVENVFQKSRLGLYMCSLPLGCWCFWALSVIRARNYMGACVYGCIYPHIYIYSWTYIQVYMCIHTHITSIFMCLLMYIESHWFTWIPILLVHSSFLLLYL